MLANGPAFNRYPSIFRYHRRSTMYWADDGNVLGGTVSGRRWLLNGVSQGTGTSLYLDQSTAGNLVLEVTATGTGGPTVVTSDALTLVPFQIVNNPLPVSTSGYYFADSSLFQASGVDTVAAGKEYNIKLADFVSPAQTTNRLRFAFADHYTLQQASNAETATPNSITIIGFAVGACLDGANWTFVQAKFGGNNGMTVDPTLNTGGVWCDDIVFPQDIPPGTHMCRRLIYTTTAGNSVPRYTLNKRHFSDTFPTPAPIFANYANSSDTFSASLTSQTVNTTGATTSGVTNYDACIMASWLNSPSDPVFWGVGDSIMAGALIDLAEFSQTPMGTFTFSIAGFDENTVGRRMIAANFGCPGTSPEDWVAGGANLRKFKLVKQLPNRPYTHIVSEHYTNNASSTQAAFRTVFQNWYALLKSESQYWGGAPAQIVQTGPIPKTSSTDLWSSLANQTVGTPWATDIRRGLFLADLQAGFYTDLWDYIPIHPAVSHDLSANIGKFKEDAYAGTLTSASLTTDSVFNVSSPLARGDTVILNPGGTGQFKGDVKSVSNGGLTITLSVGSPGTAYAQGTAVKKAFGLDAVSHLTIAGQIAARAPVTAWKIAKFG